MSDKEKSSTSGFKATIAVIAIIVIYITILLIAPNSSNQTNYLGELFLIIATSFGFFFLFKAFQLFSSKKLKAILCLVAFIVLIAPSIGIFSLVSSGGFLSPCTEGGFFGEPSVKNEACFGRWSIFCLAYYCLTFISGFFLRTVVETVSKEIGKYRIVKKVDDSQAKEKIQSLMQDDKIDANQNAAPSRQIPDKDRTDGET